MIGSKRECRLCGKIQFIGGAGPTYLAKHPICRSCTLRGRMKLDNLTEEERIIRIRDQWKTASHRRREKQRRRAIALLGGKCCRCGFDDPRVLQVDHINGGGNKEHLKLGSNGIVLRVLRGEPGYQLLCSNCNWIKRVENNETGGRKF